MSIEDLLRLKAELRTQMRQKRRGITERERVVSGEKIAERLLSWSLLPAEATIATFLSLPEEIPTDCINRELQAANYRLVVPVLSREARGYRFAEWRPGEELAVGPMKVREPVDKRYLPHTAIDLVVVPGLAYGLDGGRVGFGGGHYDRMLADCRADAMFVAIGYDFQIVAEVPQLERDIRMGWLLTPNGIVETAEQQSN